MPPSNRVLIVEDDPQVQLALRQIFQGAGYEVLLAKDGADAIELLDPRVPPRAVLVDLLMPGIVGHELLDYVRDEPALASVPVAIISGSPHLAPAGYKVFPKPLEAQALLDFVRSHATHPIRPEPKQAP